MSTSEEDQAEEVAAVQENDAGLIVTLTMPNLKIQEVLDAYMKELTEDSNRITDGHMDAFVSETGDPSAPKKGVQPGGQIHFFIRDETTSKQQAVFSVVSDSQNTKLMLKDGAFDRTQHGAALEAAMNAVLKQCPEKKSKTKFSVEHSQANSQANDLVRKAIDESNPSKQKRLKEHTKNTPLGAPKQLNAFERYLKKAQAAFEKKIHPKKHKRPGP